jgi:CHAT domain-containing protein
VTNRLSAATTIFLGAACCALLGGLARLRDPLETLNGLAAAMPEGLERIAGTPPGRQTAPSGFSARDVSTWPAPGLEAVRASLVQSWSPSTSTVRLSAAVEFFRGECPAAAALLEAALRERPTSPQLLNDAAAAQACAARRSLDEAGPAAVRAIDRALAAAAARPQWVEPWINLASAYETLGLRRFAVDALTRAGAVEPDAARARAIAERLKGLVTAPVAVTDRFPDATYYALLSRWAERAARGQTTVVEEAELERLGQSSAAFSGDPFEADVAHAIGRATPAVRQSLIQGHLAYHQGRELYDSGEREQAGEAFVRARALCALVDPALEADAHLQQVIVLYQLRNLAAAGRELEGVSAAVRQRGYRALEARASWIAALVDMQAGLIDRSFASHLAALEEYQALGDTENAAGVANSAADTLRIAGDSRRGWPMLVRAARATSAVASAQRRYLVLFNLSLYAQDEGLMRAAETFQDAAIVEADRRGSPLTIVESRLRRAQLRVKRHDLPDARRDLASAEASLPAVQSSVSYAYLGAWRDRVRAEIEMPRAPAAASGRFEGLTGAFDRLEPAEVPSVYLEAARAAARAGDARTAERQLRLGTQYVLDRGDRLQKMEFRAGYLSAAWNLFHDLIGLQFERDTARALAVAESARRALSRRDPGRGNDTSVAADLPPDTLLLYYSVLSDRVLLWTLRQQHVMSRTIPYAEADLTADVDAYREALVTRHPEARTGPLARRLYDRLVAPALEPADPDLRRLLIAADGPLGDLPFSALPEPSPRRLLIDRFEIALVAGLPHPSAPLDGSSPPTVLAVGFNGGTAGLPRLDAAEREAAIVGALYRQSALLTGATATAGALRNASSAYDVIHVAAHAQANRLMPWESRLMLASPDGGDGALRFDTIETWDLRKCRLVVLSACETATTARTRGQGLLSLATPFLDAGARVVIGTLWPVDDRASAMFMSILHRHVAAGEAPGPALRAAQIEALTSADPALSAPSIWAAYVATTR